MNPLTPTTFKCGALIHLLKTKYTNISLHKKNHHVATIFENNNTHNLHSIGINDFKETYPGCSYSLHAEMQAILKFPPPKKKKRIRKINMIVIRFNSDGKLKNSKPCINCLKFISFHSKKMSYIMNNIYYSNDDGTISCAKFSSLLYDTSPHVSGWFKKN